MVIQRVALMKFGVKLLTDQIFILLNQRIIFVWNYSTNLHQQFEKLNQLTEITFLSCILMEFHKKKENFQRQYILPLFSGVTGVSVVLGKQQNWKITVSI